MAKLKEFFKKYHISLVLKIALILFMLGFLFFNFNLFFKSYSPITHFAPTDFSPAFYEDTPLTFNFKPDKTRIEGIKTVFIKESPACDNYKLSLKIYDDQNTLIHEQQADISSFSSADYAVFEINKEFNTSKLYTVEFSTNAPDEAAGLRVNIGSATGSEITQSFVGATQIENFFDIYIYYPVLQKTLFLMALFFVLLCVMFLFVPTPKKRAVKILFNIAAFFAFPAVIIYLTEALQFNSLFAIEPIRLILAYCFMLCVYIILFLVTGSSGFSLSLCSVFFSFCAVANYLSLIFRGSSIIPSDLFAFSAATSVLKNYTIDLTSILIIVIFVLILVFCFSGFFNLQIRFKKVYFLNVILAIILSAFVTFQLLSPTSFFVRNGLLPEENQNATSKLNGFFYDFLINIHLLNIDSPPLYSPTLFNSLEHSQLPSDNPTPNIIFIMNESFTDYTQGKDNLTTSEPIPFIRSLQNDTASSTYVGSLVVPVFGGGTSCTEFEVLTGQSLLFHYVTSPYSLLIRQNPLAYPKSFEQLGYQATSFHCYNPTNWNRKTAYPKMGFSETLFTATETHPTQGISVLTDQAGFDTILSTLQKTFSPDLFFNVTIQNHASYTHDLENFPVKVTENLSATLSDVDISYMNVFLSLMHLSDTALKNFTTQLSTFTEPTIVVFFGDHLPNLRNSFTDTCLNENNSSLPRSLRAYETPLVLWANYDVDFSDMPPVLSANYLMPFVKQMAGLPLTGFDKFLLETYKSFPIISQNGIVDAENNFYTYEDLKDNETMMLYSNIFYNMLIDTSHNPENFFDYE